MENEWKDISFTNVDVVFGGDHGQGVFGAAIKVILWDNNGRIVESAVRKVGHIDCSKDTYEVLEATIALPLNESLKRMKGKQLQLSYQEEELIPMFLAQDELVTSTVQHSVDPFGEGALVTQGGSAATAPGAGSFPNGPIGTRERNTLHRDESIHDVNVFGVGDLAFISMVLGKVNMDGCWCYLCDLSPAEWAEKDHDQGCPWTLSRMNEKLAKLESGMIRDTPGNRRGCVKKSLIDALEPCDFIPPCLHMMMGAFNDALKNLLKYYIDERHEKISPGEEEKRNAFWSADAALANAQDELKQFKEQMVQERQNKEAEIATLEERKGMLNPPGSSTKYVYSQEQKRVFMEQISLLKGGIAQLRMMEKTKKESVVMKKALRDTAKKELLDERKKRKTVDSVVRQKIEELLMTHGIDRGASHGGELTGVSCLVMEERIVPLMESIRLTLKAIEGSDVPPEEVDEVMESYEIHFLLLSKVFSLARTERHVVKDPFRKPALLEELREAIDLVNTSTKRLGMSMRTPKRHICEDHLVTFINVHDGIAEYLEDWLEQTHQTYKKISSRGKIWNKETKGNYESKQEAISHSIDVREAGKAMLEKTRRRFRHQNTRNNQRSAAASRKQARHQRRRDAVERAHLLFATKPTLLGDSVADACDLPEIV
jgi:hypothetical protein